jgi:hypothetical protein
LLVCHSSGARPFKPFVLAVTWFVLLKSYQDLNRAKFQVIDELDAGSAGADLPLTASAQEACEARAERAGALDCKHTPTRCVLIDEPQSMRVPVAARVDGRLKQDGSADDVHDRKRVRVAVRVDADHVVQLICKHP